MVQAYSDYENIKAYEIDGDFSRKSENKNLNRQQFNDSVAKGYMEMAEINLEEANAAIHRNNDGMFK